MYIHTVLFCAYLNIISLIKSNYVYLPEAFNIDGSDAKIRLEEHGVRGDLGHVTHLTFQRLTRQNVGGRVLVQPAIGLLHELTKNRQNQTHVRHRINGGSTNSVKQTNQTHMSDTELMEAE